MSVERVRELVEANSFGAKEAAHALLPPLLNLYEAAKELDKAETYETATALRTALAAVEVEVGKL